MWSSNKHGVLLNNNAVLAYYLINATRLRDRTLATIPYVISCRRIKIVVTYVFWPAESLFKHYNEIIYFCHRQGVYRSWKSLKTPWFLLSPWNPWKMTIFSLFSRISTLFWYNPWKINILKLSNLRHHAAHIVLVWWPRVAICCINVNFFTNFATRVINRVM